MKGPHFITLRELFGQVTDGVEGYIDLLGERIVQLGGRAEGTAYLVSRRTSLERYPLASAESNGHIEALATVLACFGKHVRYAIGQVADLLDNGSTDLFTEISRGTDSWLWLIVLCQEGLPD